MDILSGMVTLRGSKWTKIDFGYASLPHLRFHDASIVDCRFDAAVCDDWRLWNTEVSASTFSGASLRDASLGTWENNRGNSWLDVAFDGADLRGAQFRGGSLIDCDFRTARLDGVKFLEATLIRCPFSGVLRHTLFDGREMPAGPAPAELKHADFSAAVFESVEIRGYVLKDVLLPPGVRVIHRYVQSARSVLGVVSSMTSVEGRQAAAVLSNNLKWPGREDQDRPFNRIDFVANGGEALADLLETLFLETGAFSGP